MKKIKLNIVYTQDSIYINSKTESVEKEVNKVDNKLIVLISKLKGFFRKINYLFMY